MTQSHFELKYLLPFITENSIYEKVISSSILNAKHSAIPGLMNEIIRESEEKQYGYELAIKNHIGGIFLWLLRYWHANGEEPLLEDFENQQLKQQLSPALTYMITNYEKSISAADMAKLCNLSYSYFSRSFNRLLHMNFSDYLNEIRIREAEKLLVSTTQNVTEIASAVGFCTTSYFIKQFTKYLHISPKQYQKQMRQGTERFHCITTQHKL
jgi:AraC-like DNA-binding protein